MNELAASMTNSDPPEQTPSPRALLELAPYLLRYKPRIVAALFAVTVAAAATLSVPLAIRRMIDFGFSAASAGLINSYFFGLVAVAAVLALASGSRFFFVTTLAERVRADLRSDVFKHLCRLDAAFFDTARTGELMSRLTADTTQMKSAFGSTAAVALRNFFLFAGAVAMMVYTSPKLSAAVLIAIPIIVLPLVGSGRLARKRSRTAQDTLAEASSYAAENLAAVRVMQAFGAEPAAGRHFGAAVEEAYAAARNAAVARAGLTIVVIFLVFASIVGVLWFGARDVLAGRMTGGLLSPFVLYAILAAGALSGLVPVWGDRPVARRGELAFEHVDFAYPARPQDSALHGLSFKVAPGETVAIVGPSGAGKTTLLQLLSRFYDPVSGRILLDGVDIKSVDPGELRRRIKSVPQDPVIFAASIAHK